MGLTYTQIEAQALDILKLGVPTITSWTRSWTNNGRREVQRAHSYHEMLRLHPEEDEIGSKLQLSAGDRVLSAPIGLKEEFAERDGLFYLDGNQELSLLRRPYAELVSEYANDDTGPPRYYHRLLDEASKDVTEFHVFPKPDVAYSMRLYGFFYLPDLGMGENDGNVEDWLSRMDPMLVRDAILREAYLALDMDDVALRRAQAVAARRGALERDDRRRQASNKMILRPSLRAGDTEAPRTRPHMGYPWWGKW